VFEDRWENEGGKPYLNRDFTEVNPDYFEYADRRLKHLIDSGLVRQLWEAGAEATATA